MRKLLTFLIALAAVVFAVMEPARAFWHGSALRFADPIALVTDGDSITAGVFLNTVPWPMSYSDTMAIATGNVAVSGQTLATMLTNYPSVTAPLFNANRYNVLIEDGGTNDLVAGTTAVSLLATLQSYCSAAHTTGYRVYAVTIIPRNDVGWSGADETQRLAYNASLLAGFASNCDAIIDFNTIPQTQNTANATYFQADQLHPTNSLAVLLAAKVQNSFTGSPRPATDVFNVSPLVGAATYIASNQQFNATANSTTVNVSTALSGKKVFAMASNLLNAAFGVIGVGVAGTNNAIGEDSNNFSIGYYNPGDVIQNAGFVLGAGTLPTFADWAVIGVIVDTPNSKMWITQDGVNYYGNSGTALTAAQVSVGTGGLDLSLITAQGSIFPMAGCLSNSNKTWRNIAFPWGVPGGYSQY
jgi:hypothetical protein